MLLEETPSIISLRNTQALVTVAKTAASGLFPEVRKPPWVEEFPSKEVNMIKGLSLQEELGRQCWGSLPPLQLFPLGTQPARDREHILS